MPIYYPPLGPGQSYTPQTIWSQLPQLAEIISRAMLVRGERKREDASNYAQMIAKLTEADPAKAAIMAQELANNPDLNKLIGTKGAEAFRTRAASMPTTTNISPSEFSTENVGGTAIPKISQSSIFRPYTTEELQRQQAGGLDLQKGALEVTSGQQNIAMNAKRLAEADVAAGLRDIDLAQKYTVTINGKTRAVTKADVLNPSLATTIVPTPELQKKIEDYKAVGLANGVPQADIDMGINYLITGPAKEMDLRLGNLRLEGAKTSLEMAKLLTENEYIKLQMETKSRLTPADQLARQRFGFELMKTIQDTQDAANKMAFGLKDAGGGWKFLSMLISKGVGLFGTNPGLVGLGANTTPEPDFASLQWGVPTPEAVTKDLDKVLPKNKGVVYKMIPDPTDPKQTRLKPSNIVVSRADLVSQIVQLRRANSMIPSYLIKLAETSPDDALVFVKTQPDVIAALRVADPQWAKLFEDTLNLGKRVGEVPKVDPNPAATDYYDSVGAKLRSQPPTSRGPL